MTPMSVAATRCNRILRTIIASSTSGKIRSHSAATSDYVHGQSSADDPARFANIDFWDEYHQNSSSTKHHHEWFVDPELVIDAMLPYIESICKPGVERGGVAAARTGGVVSAPEPAILDVGCGTSVLGAQVAGLPVVSSARAHVTSVDYSDVAIEAMRSRFGSERHTWVVADALNLPFEAASFDLVLDKGLFDAFECADHSRSAQTEKGDGTQMSLLCKEIDRVMKRHVNALWIQVTHTDPDLRLDVLAKSLPCISGGSVHDTWSVRHRCLDTNENGFEYFMYIIQRQKRYAVFRIDTHGVETHMADFVDQAEAQAVAEAYDARGHHQGYIVRPIGKAGA